MDGNIDAAAGETADTGDTEVDNEIDNATTAEEESEADSGAENNDEEFTDTPADNAYKKAEGGEKQADANQPGKEPKGKPDAGIAERRRQQEAKMQEVLAKERESAYTKGKVEALIGIKNQFTDEVIESEADARVFQKMLECEKAGFDPITEMYKFERQEIKKQAETAKTQRSQEDWYKDDRAEFEKAHPDIEFDQLSGDKVFIEFAKNKLGKTPLNTIYEDFNYMNALIEKRLEIESKNRQSKQAAAVGSLSAPPTEGIVDFDNMSDEEFERYERRVRSGELKKT
jgi:hypothetical protein